VHTVASTGLDAARRGMRKQQELRPVTMKCGNGHTFSWQLPHKLHYIDQLDAPVRATLMNYVPVKCQVPGCGAMAVVEE
jgi:hypothetical protein